MTQARIFISHGSSEKEQAQQIANSLEGLGVSTWLALRDVKAGQNFAQSIIDAIEGSTHLLVLMTESSIHSQHVKREVAHAVDQQKTLLPLFYGLNTDNQKALPSEWRYWLVIAQAIVWNDYQDPGQVIMPHLASAPPQSVFASGRTGSDSSTPTGKAKIKVQEVIEREGSLLGAPATAPLRVVVDVNESNFQQLVLDRSSQIPVVIEFWAEWCAPCKQLSPVLEMLTAEQGGRVILAKIDVDANQQLLATFQVQSIPSVFLAIGGQVSLLFLGAINQVDHLRQVFTKVLEQAASQRITGILTPTGEVVG